MTWYASQIFASPRPEVVAALRSAFPGSLYLIHGLPVSWQEAAGRLVMPAEGLLVVRELCDPGDSTDAGRWFGDDAVSWHLADDHPDEPVLMPGEGPDHPPASLLRFISRLSAATDSVLSLYCAATWGGDIEYAYSWVFEGRSGAGKVYVHGGDGDVLTLTLDHHGIRLDGGWFAAHARDFDWDRYRLDGNRENASRTATDG